MPTTELYWWVDGIHTGLRGEGPEGQCLLVIIGVTPDGFRLYLDYLWEKRIYYLVRY